MGKHFLSKAKSPNKNAVENDGRCDIDADYTIKESYYKDGKIKVKKTKYFGYRCHLLVDVNY